MAAAICVVPPISNNALEYMKEKPIMYTGAASLTAVVPVKNHGAFAMPAPTKTPAHTGGVIVERIV